MELRICGLFALDLALCIGVSVPLGLGTDTRWDGLTASQFHEQLVRMNVSANLWSLSLMLGEPQVCPRGIQVTSLQTACHDAPPRTGGLKWGSFPMPLPWSVSRWPG